MEQIELKPCPFCGGNAYLGSDQDNCIYVICYDCNAQADWFNFGEEIKAFNAWNRRFENDNR